jgi:Na+/melibiose symporter-like transporter
MIKQNAISFRRLDYIKITIFGFALTALWQSLHTITLPVRLLDFVPEGQENTYLGLLTLSGLLLAMFVQPLAGAVSDRSKFRWGRRRPFVLAGGIVALLLIPGLGFAGSYATIFTVYCLLQVATNIAQGPYQAFIPEQVPVDKRGRASGIKGLLEITGGLLLVYLSSIFIDRYAAGGGSHLLWVVLGILMAVVLVTMAATVFLVSESRVSISRSHAPLLETIYCTFRKDIWRNRSFIWFLLSRLLVFMAFTTIQQFGLYYFKDVLGVEDPAGATFRFSVVAVAGMLTVVWLAGYLSDRIGRRLFTVASGLLGALGIGIIALSQEYNTVLWAAGIIGVAMGIFNSSNWALATDFAPKGEEARYLGVANMATAGGAVLARVIGPGIDFFNSRTALSGYTFMLLMCLGYFLVGAALVIKIKRGPQLSQGKKSNNTEPI